MTRKVQTWLLLLLAAPLLMHFSVQAVMYLYGLIIRGKPITYGAVIPSFLDVLCSAVFAWPVAIGAYYFVLQSNPRRRLWIGLGMGASPVLLWTIQVLDRLAYGDVDVLLMHINLLFALALGLGLYVFLIMAIWYWVQNRLDLL